MARTTLATRIEALERTVNELATVPERIAGVERELAEFRIEVRNEFAAVRHEVREGDEETRRYMRVLYEDLLDRLKIMGEGIDELRHRR